ncbi:hypothetical protein QYE76_003646 [Lolium multiflorum]|uniref:RING-type domain-containing protein n=1 Tax=Lolium multiflorum TaxID=4521 RepID=A0AAD8RP44_LOLMU|nr:hypothetical protein QYE76_003646 [Lolium multiflorum]
MAKAQSSLNSRTDTSTPANITNTERPAAMPRPSPLQELLSDTVIFAIFFIYTRPQGQGSGSGGASATAGEPAAAAGEECAVCLGVLEDGDVCCVLPACRHEFHRECMRQWFMTGKTTCPLCRAKVQQLAVADIV